MTDTDQSNQVTITPQYVFRNGHWWDQWNNTEDTDVLMDGWQHSDEWATQILPTCGCWDPSIIADAMAEYLRRCIEQFADYGRGVQGFRWESREHMLADYLLASMADQLGFTEHGSSLSAAWLEPAGERWLELYDRAKQAP